MNDELLKKLERAHDWFNTNCRVIIQRLHDFNREGALTEIEKSRTELATSDIEEEIVSYLNVRLRYVEWQASKINCTPEETRGMRNELLAYLAAPDDCELSRAARRMTLVQLRTQMLRDEGVVYGPVEFREHYHSIPPEMYTNEFDLHVGSWAYLANDMEILEKVFGEFTVSPGQFQISFVWQTINLAYQLRTGKASVKDVMEMVKVLQHIRQWQYIEKLLWKDCVASGLVDEQVKAQLDKKLAELNIEAAQFIQREQRTKRILKDM